MTYEEGLLELEDATDCAGAAREDHEMVTVSVGAINAVLDRLEALAGPPERDGWVLAIDRIVPALDPVGEEFPAEWALYMDRTRIRAELRAFLSSAPKPEEG